MDVNDRSQPGLPYDAPEDLFSFWSEALGEAMAAPLDLHRSHRPEREHPTHVVETISFRGVDGELRRGWLAAPPDARRLPGFLWVPPYGRWSMLPNEYGTREGMVSLSFNLHGESAFHEEAYRTERGYFAEGIDEPETWIFRRFFCDCVIAARLMRALTEVDEERLGAMGMSQGGGIAIWLGAFAPMILAVAADMPFLGGVGQTLRESVMRYPLKEVRDAIERMPLGEPRVFNTLSYFDTSLIAAHCEVPTQVSLGLKDPACRPASVQSIFEALPGEKRLIQYDWGHDWHKDMVPNNHEWLLRAFDGAA